MADLIKDINSLAIFGGLRKKAPLESLAKFLKLADEGTNSQNDLIEAYAEFVNSVYQLRPDADFSGALWDALKTDDNAYINFRKTNIMRVLDILTRIGNTSYINLQSMLFFDGYIAQFKSTGIDMKARYMELLSSLET